MPHTLDILNSFKANGKISEIVVVNDGSTDNTEKIAREKRGVKHDISQKEYVDKLYEIISKV